MNIIGRNYMRITSKNERVYLNSVNKVTFINNKRERERERGGGGGGSEYSSRRSNYYSKCLQVLIQGEMLMKFWVNVNI